MIKRIIYHTYLSTFVSPKAGGLVKVMFDDYSTAYVYEETFYRQITGYKPEMDINGKSINTESDYFDYFTPMLPAA